MKRLLITMLFILILMGCKGMSNYETLKQDVYLMGENIIILDTEFSVLNAEHHPFDQSLYKNEKLIYVYITYQGFISFTSSSLQIILPNDDIKNAYMVDGLDYLTGPQQASIPYVRFSIPQNIEEFILIIDDETHVLITWS